MKTAVVCVLLSVCLLVVLFLLIREKRRTKKQAEELVAYIRQVAGGVYDLKIADNDEGIFSLLTNEIYKIAVQLKENAENSRLESENLSRALADISHQIKTPLTSVQIMLDTLSDDPDMEEATRQDFLRKCAVQIDSVNTLVVTLLNLAKFDSGVVKLNRMPVCMGDLLKEATDALAILAEVRDVTVTVSGDTDALIMIDPKWELEAYKNLVKNAIEHSRAGGAVTLETDDTPLFLRVFVRDAGEGIADRDLRHIFERFYKSAGSDKESFGIGLSLTRTVIEMDGGIITADSVRGEGTTFTVRYPKSLERDSRT